jgi:hypothetical protein
VPHGHRRDLPFFCEAQTPQSSRLYQNQIPFLRRSPTFPFPNRYRYLAQKSRRVKLFTVRGFGAFKMANPSAYSYSPPLVGFENAPLLPNKKDADGKKRLRLVF